MELDKKDFNLQLFQPSPKNHGLLKTHVHPGHFLFDPEDPTLDPANRTLVQVSMRDVGAADDMFRVLMGDKVEPRREFIEKHALDVRNLDV